MMVLVHGLRRKLAKSYQAYVESYKDYLDLRGYGGHLNDGPFFRRAFLECWLEPGFHRFWQVWNPGIAFFAYHLYMRFGGRKRRWLATLMAFFVNGCIHNLVVSLLLWRFSFPLPWTFLAFGVCSLQARRLERRLRFKDWPRIVHLVANAGLVALCFDLGFRINAALLLTGICGQ